MSNRTIFVASTLFISSLAGADIGFGAAIDGARAAAPAANLFSIQQRERNGAMVYEGELYNMELTSRFQPRLDIESGELIRLDVNAVGKQARMALQPIAAVLPGQPAVAQPIANDPDGDSLEFRFRWSVNDEVVEGAEEASLATGNLESDDRIRVQVAPLSVEISTSALSNSAGCPSVPRM